MERAVALLCLLFALLLWGVTGKYVAYVMYQLCGLRVAPSQSVRLARQQNAGNSTLL